MNDTTEGPLFLRDGTVAPPKCEYHGSSLPCGIVGCWFGMVFQLVKVAPLAAPTTLGEAAKGAADLVAELEAMEQVLDAAQAERQKVTEQAVRLTAENDQLRVDFAKDMAAIASYRNDIADLRGQLEAVHARAQRVDLQLAEVKRKVDAAVRILHDGYQQAPVGEKREAVIVAALEVLRG